MANNNEETDTSIAQDLQTWFFPPQTLASNSPWNVFPGPNTENAFSVMDKEPQPHNKAVAYNSLLNQGPSRLCQETMEQDKDTEWRHRLASDGSGEEDEQRPGKRHQAKNLVAERKRREKIRNGLHALRAIVPKITKMDKASILGDAIEYVKELQKQVKDLQDQLEGDNGISQLEPPITPGELMSQGCRPSSGDDSDDDRQQMEPQVEVKQLVASELFLMVLCEHKRGGFARLIEAINGLGLEVTNASVTTFRSLVLNVFRVEGRENRVLQAEEVRNSLVDMTRCQALQTSDSQGHQRRRVSVPPPPPPGQS